MVLVGLTGGLASGKTTIARMFENLGARIIDADQLAREVVQPGKPAWKDIKRHFGARVLHPDRTLNRAVLANVVFADPVQLRVLQNFIFPRVARQQRRLVKEIVARFPSAVVIYDAAMLIEANAHTRMDHVILVKAGHATQIKRACRRSRMTRLEALRRIKQQMPIHEKLRYADAVLDGTWPKLRLRRTVRSLYRVYHQEACRKQPGHSHSN